MKQSQRGPVSVMPVIFPHSVTPSQLCCWPKTATVLAEVWFCFGSHSGCWEAQFLLFSQFPILTEWWRVIVQSEKAKAVRVFSSLISQVQSCRLGTTYGVKRSDHWWRKRATGGLFKSWQQVRGYTTRPSSGRPYSHFVMLVIISFKHLHILQ